MLAPASMPSAFAEWNRHWASPYGRRWPLRKLLKGSGLAIRYCGPFGFQKNSPTRAFEYPWAYHEISSLGKNLNVVEVGGGVSGLQFVLARDGHRVVNIDPGLAARGKGWEVDGRLHRRIGDVWNAAVAWQSTTLARADVAPESVDVLVTVSALEHFAPADIDEFVTAARTLLRPGGRAVMTVDLFLDIEPFAPAPKNRWGRNVDLCRLLADAGLTLEKGTPAELMGFPEFDPAAIAANRDRYLVSPKYPVMSQCLVARRPTSAPGAIRRIA